MSDRRSRPTPEAVARQLRQEAYFGCVKCGNPFLEYHHIIECKDEHHFNPEHMVAVCPNCHGAFARMKKEKQYRLKKYPYNRDQRHIKGFLEFKADLLAIRMGGNTFRNCPNLIGANDEPLIYWRVLDGEFRLFAKIYDRTGETLLEIADNEIIFLRDKAWDFKFKHDLLEIKSKKHSVLLSLDLRRQPVNFVLETYVLGARAKVTPSRVLLSGMGTEDAVMRNSFVEEAEGHCIHFATDSYTRSSAYRGGNVFTMRVPDQQT